MRTEKLPALVPRKVEFCPAADSSSESSPKADDLTANLRLFRSASPKSMEDKLFVTVLSKVEMSADFH